MAPHPFSSYDSFIVSNKEEISIFMENNEKDAIFNLKNPKVTDITIQEKYPPGVHTHTITGPEKPVTQKRHIEATITIETLDWEHIWGENLEDELPDAVDDMSVEELLHAVNQKVEERNEN